MKVYKPDSFSLKITSLRLPLFYCVGKQFTFTDWKVHNEYTLSIITSFGLGASLS